MTLKSRLQRLEARQPVEPVNAEALRADIADRLNKLAPHVKLTRETTPEEWQGFYDWLCKYFPSNGARIVELLNTARARMAAAK